MKFPISIKTFLCDTWPLTSSMLLPVLIFLCSDYIKCNVLIYYGIGILFAYFTGLFTITLKMKASKLHFGPSTNELFSIILFLAWSVLLMAMFGIGWNGFSPQTHNFSLAANVVGVYDADYKITQFDGFYFSTITFTSVGYGDFIPLGLQGKIFACEEAFIGHAHTAVFFAMVIGKITNKK